MKKLEKMQDKEFEVKAEIFIKKVKAEKQPIMLDTDNEILIDVSEKILLVKDGRQLLM
jgi:hypothetical protein